MSAYRTYAFTIRPVSDTDLEYWSAALNKYCNNELWFGCIEVKKDDEGKTVPGSQHIHVAMLLRKPLRRDVVVKWVCRNAENSEAGINLGDAHIKVCRTGIRVMYSWDWMSSYVQGDWMENREPDDGDRKAFEEHFPEKNDTGLKESRKTKPSIPDKIVDLWKRDYENKIPLEGSSVLSRYVKYLMYNTKEIPLIKPRDLSDVLHHVAHMLEPPKMPEPEDCSTATWYIEEKHSNLVM